MKTLKLLAPLVFAGIIAYWYFLPYRAYNWLMTSNSIGGAIANAILLWVLIGIGVAITIFSGFLGLWLLTED